MNILQIGISSKIEIEAIYLERQKVYSTNVVSCSETRIEIAPIIEESATFDYDTIINVYYYPVGLPPVVFRNCRIYQIRINGKRKQLVSCDLEGETYTERLCERINVNRWGLLYSSKGDCIEVLVHDVSYNGFAVISETKLDDMIGNQVTVTFNEGISSISFTGRVVRNSLMNDGKVFLGCYVEDKLNDRAISYINKHKDNQSTGTLADRNKK